MWLFQRDVNCFRCKFQYVPNLQWVFTTDSFLELLFTAWRIFQVGSINDSVPQMMKPLFIRVGRTAEISQGLDVAAHNISLVENSAGNSISRHRRVAERIDQNCVLSLGATFLTNSLPCFSVCERNRKYEKEIIFYIILLKLQQVAH